MSSRIRRVISDSEAESETESGEEEIKPKVNGKQQEQEPIKVSDSESEPGSEFEEEQTKDKSNGKRRALLRQQKLKQEEEEDEIESESESESDRAPEPEPEPHHKLVRRDTNAKGAMKVPLVTHTISGKRGRDANGMKRGPPAVEHVTKKIKEAAAKDEKARSQAEKLPLASRKSPLRKERKAEQVTRGSMKATGTAASKAEKTLPAVVALPAPQLDDLKPQAGRKRKASTPPPAAASARQQHAQKVEVDKSLKPKKPFSWSSTVEETLVGQVHVDHSNGLVIPTTKVDPYWEKLSKRLPLEEGLTGFQLCDKVRRMRQRYYILKERAKEDGVKLFKSPHEERMYQLWVDIWDSGTKASKPVAEEGYSEDESAETAAAIALREVSRRTTRQSNGVMISKSPLKQSNGEGRKGAETHCKVGDSDSDDEIEEDEIQLTQREPAASNQMNAASMLMPEPVAVSPFISKPRLEFTPLVPKEKKLKVTEKVDEVISGDQHSDEVPPRGDRRKGDVVSLVDQHLKQFREETHAYFQELRGFQGVEEQRNGSLSGGFANFAYAGKGFGLSAVLEGLGAGGGSPAALELQKKWREIRIQELALHSERLQLMQEHCRLEQDELKLQNQRLEQ